MSPPLVAALIFAGVFAAGGLCKVLLASWLTELRERFSHYGDDYPMQWLGEPASLEPAALAQSVRRPTLKLLLDELPPPLGEDRRIVALVTRVRTLVGLLLSGVVGLFAAILLRD
jgi:hypothetical protein